MDSPDRHQQHLLGALAVRRAISACRKCPLRDEATAPVPWSGRLFPDVAVLGEAPGRTEDKAGVPFAGPAGNLLRGILKTHGIDPESVTYLNSANCYPRLTKTPTGEHLAACRVHLAGQLAAIQPAHLLVVGVTALQALIGDRVSLKEVRGRPLWLERLEPFARFSSAIVCWPTYHPAAALRSGTYLVKINEDVKRFVEWKEGEAFPGKCVKCEKEVEEWDDLGLAWCASHAGRQLKLL